MSLLHARFEIFSNLFCISHFESYFAYCTTSMKNRKFPDKSPSPRLRGSFCNARRTQGIGVFALCRQFINFLPSNRINNGIYRGRYRSILRDRVNLYPSRSRNRLAVGPRPEPTIRREGGWYLSRAITINRPFVTAADSAARETAILGYRWEWLVTSRSLLYLSAYFDPRLGIGRQSRVTGMQIRIVENRGFWRLFKEFPWTIEKISFSNSPRFIQNSS